MASNQVFSDSFPLVSSVFFYLLLAYFFGLFQKNLNYYHRCEQFLIFSSDI